VSYHAKVVEDEPYKRDYGLPLSNVNCEPTHECEPKPKTQHGTKKMFDKKYQENAGKKKSSLRAYPWGVSSMGAKNKENEGRGGKVTGTCFQKNTGREFHRASIERKNGKMTGKKNNKNDHTHMGRSFVQRERNTQKSGNGGFAGKHRNKKKTAPDYNWWPVLGGKGCSGGVGKGHDKKKKTFGRPQKQDGKGLA